MVQALQTNVQTLMTRLLRIHKKEEKERLERWQELCRDLDAAQSGLQTALTNFDNVKDPALIDMYIYRIQSAQTQYDHILRQIKNFS